MIRGKMMSLFISSSLAQRIYKYIITLFRINVNGLKKISVKNIFCNERNIFCENLLEIVEGRLKNFYLAIDK